MGDIMEVSAENEDTNGTEESSKHPQPKASSSKTQTIKSEDGGKDASKERSEFNILIHISLIVLFLSVLFPWYHVEVEHDYFMIYRDYNERTNIEYCIYGQFIDSKSGLLGDWDRFETWEEKGSVPLKALFYPIIILLAISFISLYLTLLKIKKNGKIQKSRGTALLLLLSSICIISIPIMFALAAPGIVEQDVNKLYSTGDDAIQISGLFGSQEYNDGDFRISWAPSFGWFFSAFAAFAQVMLLVEYWREKHPKSEKTP